MRRKKSVKDVTLVYHITRLENLKSIIKYDIRCRAELIKNSKYCFSDSGNTEILDRREMKGLDEYVPFHFLHDSPCAYRMQVDNPNADYVILAMDRNVARYRGYKVTPLHPLSQYAELELYDYEQGFDKIDWNLMDTYNDINKEDEDTRKRRNAVKMAECLSETNVPITDLALIFTKNEKVKEEVEKLLKEAEDTNYWGVEFDEMMDQLIEDGIFTIDTHTNDYYLEEYDDIQVYEENPMNEVDLDMDYDQYHVNMELMAKEYHERKQIEEKMKMDKMPTVLVNKSMFLNRK